MRIGNVELESNVLLCPIAAYTDLPFRRMVRRLGGLGLAYTELVSPRGWKEGSRRSLQIVETSEDDRPLAVQIYGTEAEELAEAAVWAAELGAVVVDINMGCPVPKIAGRGGGSGLLRCGHDPVGLAEAVVRKSPIPVTVKTRLGWEIGNLVAPDLVPRFEDVGVAAVTIHGRYGEQKFAGSVDRSAIARVVESAGSIPIIANGDIRSADDALAMLRETGAAGVMIGRHALGDPWIFHETTTWLQSGERPTPPTRLERTLLMVDHFRMMVERYGPQAAVIQFRKRMTGYAKMIGPCPRLRREIPYIQSVAEFDALVGEFLDDLIAGRALEPKPGHPAYRGEPVCETS